MTGLRYAGLRIMLFECITNLRHDGFRFYHNIADIAVLELRAGRWGKRGNC